MAMEEGLDTGPVLLEQRIPIGLCQNAETLAMELSQLTAKLMIEAMDLIFKAGMGSEAERLVRLNVQNQGVKSSYARMLKKEDFQIKWNDSALLTHRKVMGLYPSAYTVWRNKRLKLTDTEPLIERFRDEISADARVLLGQWSTGGDQPGTVLACINHVGIVVSTSGCPILIREAQLEGKGRSRAQVLIQQLDASTGDTFQ
jgi:methionyl-tRNA formyltransferase